MWLCIIDDEFIIGAASGRFWMGKIDGFIPGCCPVLMLVMFTIVFVTDEGVGCISTLLDTMGPFVISGNGG